MPPDRSNSVVYTLNAFTSFEGAETYGVYSTRELAEHAGAELVERQGWAPGDEWQIDEWVIDAPAHSTFPS